MDVLVEEVEMLASDRACYRAVPNRYLPRTILGEKVQ